MNLLKVGAVVVGGIVVFFIVDSLIHVFLGLLTAIAFVAIVGGGAYVAVKIAGARKRRQVKRRDADLSYNLRTFTELQSEATGFNWAGWVAALGGSPEQAAEFIVPMCLPAWNETGKFYDYKTRTLMSFRAPA